MQHILAQLSRTALLLAVACGVYGTVVFGFKVPIIGWCVLGFLILGRAQSLRRAGGGYAYGTARWGVAGDLYANDLYTDGRLDGDGLILGGTGYMAGPSFGQAFQALLSLPPWRSDAAVSLAYAAFEGKKWCREGIIRVRDFCHVMTVAKTGAGKGVSVLVPNLLSYTGSCVVTDPKAELAHLTGQHRRLAFNHSVLLLNPFDLFGLGSATFNPMCLIDADSPYLIDQSRDLASMLVVRTGKEHDQYWNDMAEAVLTTFIAYVAACESTQEFRNLQTVRALVCDRDKFNNALAVMKQSNACGGMLSRQAASLGWLVEKELGSVLASVQRHTNFLDSPAIDASTSSSSFDPRELKTKKMTVYLCLPPDKQKSLEPLLRMWVGSILRAVAMGGANERNPVLFFLDEAGHLGQMPVLEDAVTELRGYGVRLWFFFQSIGQVTTCFGDRAQVILDNIDTQQFFGIKSFTSAEALSKQLGDETITNQSYNETSGSSRSYGGKGEQGVNVSTSRSVTHSQMGRALARPDEITRSPADMAVVLHKNLPPICAKLLRYYDAPQFQGNRMGRPRRSGFMILLRSLSILILAALFAAFASDVPSPAPQHHNHRQPAINRRFP